MTDANSTTAAFADADMTLAAHKSRWALFWEQFGTNRLAVAGMVIFVLFFAAALTGLALTSGTDPVLNPATIYGISKRAGEGLARHYARRFGLDIRGLRYPGIISGETLPGGGTTDYAVEIFYAADSSGHYQCFVREDTVLPMMYMPDCIKATLDLMDAPPDGLSQPECYNVAGMSFSAGQLAQEIRHHLPGFTCSFVPDRRQAIADSWPMRVDDQLARQEWDWNPSFGLSSMVEDMMARF